MSVAGALLARLPFASPAARVGVPNRPGLAAAEPVTGPAAAAIVLRGITKAYPAPAGPVPALSGIDIAIPAGCVFGVIGRSGAGKSTLLRLINGLERPTAGQVLIEGADVAGLDGDGLVALRRRVGMVFQHFNLLSAKTVRDNVALPLLVAGVRRPEAARRVADALALVGLADKVDAYPARLSGGQKQRVGIARALVSRPRILLCDEATSALDPEATLSILRLLRDLNRRLGLTIVLITHEMSVIREVCDRVLVLERGAAVEAGPVWQVFGQPTHPATRALLRSLARPLPDDLAARLLPGRRPGRRDDAILELLFTGEDEPDLAALAGRLGGPLRLIDGALDRIAGHTQGRLLVAATLAPDRTLPDLATLAPAAEVLGYVAADG